MGPPPQSAHCRGVSLSTYSKGCLFALADTSYQVVCWQRRMDTIY